MTDTDKTIPEVQDDSNKKKIWIGLGAVILCIFVLYANIATSKKSYMESNIDDVAPVLSFNDSSDPMLTSTRSNFKIASINNKIPSIQNETDVKGNALGNTKGNAEIDPEKLLEFKRMLDSANEKRMQEVIKRRKSSTLIYDNQTTSVVPVVNSDNKKASSFMQQVDKSTEVVSANRTTNLATSILEGTIIHATLETAVNSDLPGSMRAVINRPVYSADGINRLLNPGDRLVMKYTSKVTKGATRVFAVGSRIIKSDGVSIQLGSEIASKLGVTGVGADSVDSHFFEKFAEASLLAVLSAGAATMNVSDEDQWNSLSLYRGTIADSFAESANKSLDQNADRQPTLHIGQGKEISVFVAKDINFDEVYGDRI